MTIESVQYSLQGQVATIRIEDGHISERQRRVLNSIIASMGIDTKIAEQLENDALAALAN